MNYCLNGCNYVLKSRYGECLIIMASSFQPILSSARLTEKIEKIYIYIYYSRREMQLIKSKMYRTSILRGYG